MGFFLLRSAGFSQIIEDACMATLLTSVRLLHSFSPPILTTYYVAPSSFRTSQRSSFGRYIVLENVFITHSRYMFVPLSSSLLHPLINWLETQDSLIGCLFFYFCFASYFASNFYLIYFQYLSIFMLILEQISLSCLQLPYVRGHLPRVSDQSRLSGNDKADISIKRGLCTDLSEYTLQRRKTP